jgi:hypothetical protein
MDRTGLSEDQERELAEYEARLARPILAVEDITDDLIHVLAETGTANRLLKGPTLTRRPSSPLVDRERPDLRLEHDYGIGDGLDDFEDRQRQLKATLTAILKRGRVNVTTVVRILRAAKQDVLHLRIERIARNPRLVAARRAISKQLEGAAKKALSYFVAVPADLPISPWAAVYWDVLEAVKHDPFLNPPPPRRLGETRHQELLKDTKAGLRQAGVSATDTKILVQATGLVELLNAKRPRPSRPK